MKKVIILFIAFLLFITKVGAEDIKRTVFYIYDNSSSRKISSNTKDNIISQGSFTRLMTALVLEEQLDEKLPITVVSEALRGNMNSRFSFGENLSKYELLDILLNTDGVSSGLIGTITVARRNLDKKDLNLNEATTYFLGLMRKKAISLGLDQTKFNSSVINVGNKTSIKDLIKIYRALIDNKKLKKLIIKKDVDIKASTDGLYKEDHKFVSVNKPVYDLTQEGIYDEVSTSIITSDSKNRNLTVVILDARSIEDVKQQYQVAFNNLYKDYKNFDILQENEIAKVYKLINPKKGNDDTLYILSKEPFKYLTHKDHDNKINIVLEPDKKLLQYKGEKLIINQSFRAGSKIGSIVVKYEDRVIHKGDAYTVKEVIPSNIFNTVYYYLFDKYFYIGRILIPALILAGVFLFFRYKVKR